MKNYCPIIQKKLIHFKKQFFSSMIVFLAIGLLTFLSCTQQVEEHYVTPIWKGSRNYAPSKPDVGWAYYNISEKKSYIYDGKKWQILSQDGKDGIDGEAGKDGIDGKNGENGKDGIDGSNGKDGINGIDGFSIVWQGELANSPENPKLNWAYYNLIDGNSYIYNGYKWDFFAKSGRNGSSGILLWLGSLDSIPDSNSVSEGYAYYNTNDKKSYVYNGYSWDVIAQDGMGIEWKGVLSSNPENPQINWAYYNTTTQSSYIFNGTNWDLFAASGNATIYVSIVWKGTSDYPPENPEIGWAYYNSQTGCSYIYDGTWNIIAKNGADGRDGTNGTNGTNGTDGKDGADGTSGSSSSSMASGYLITWKGSFTSDPDNPKAGWAYYNSIDKKSYIYDGSSWCVLAQDGKDGKDGKDGVDGTNSSSSTSGSGNSDGNTGASTSDQNWLYVLIYTQKGNYTQYGQTSITTVDFGQIGLESVSKTTNFWLGINGMSTTTLTLTGTPAIQISGNDADQFEIIQPSKKTTKSGTYIQDACITFKPTSIGQKTATITIPNDSPDLPNFSFTITGTGSYFPKTFDGGEGDGNDAVTKLLIDSSGNLYAVGYGYELINDHSGYDWWIKKFNSTGVEQWEKKLDFYDDYNNSGKDTPKYAVLDSNDNLIVSSGYNTIKLSPSGTKIWELSVGGNLACDSENNIFIGNSKYSSNGSLLWTNEFITTPIFDSSNNVFSNNGRMIVKVNSDGSNNWKSVSVDSTGRYNGETENGNIDYFAYSVTNGKKYLITWDDYCGTTLNSKNALIYVSAKYGNSSFIFKDQTGGYGSLYKKITASQTGNLIVSARQYFYSGTYALAVYENYEKGGDFASSDWTIGTLEKNGSKTYSLNVTNGRPYIICAKDKDDDSSLTNDVKISASYSDNTSIFSRESSTYNSPKLFFATKTDSITVTVEPYSSSYSGTYGITMKELNYIQPSIPGFDCGISNVVSMCLDSSNNIYVAGYETNKVDSYSKKDIVIKKFSSDGTEITSGWNKTIDYGHCDDEVPLKILFDGTDIVMLGEGHDSVSGSSASDGLFYKFNISGTPLTHFKIPRWTESSSYSKYCDYLGIDSLGNFYFLNYDSGYYLSKYSNSGILLWENKLDITSPVSSLDKNNNIYIGGYGSNLVTSKSSCDWYIKKWCLTSISKRRLCKS